MLSSKGFALFVNGDAVPSAMGAENFTLEF